MTMRRFAIAFVAVVMAGCASFGAHADEAANKQLVLDFMKMLFVDHKVDEAIDTYVDPGYIQHNPMAATGSEAIRTFFKGFYQQSPGATIEIKRALADGDLVAVHYRANFSGKPDDRGLAVVDIFRIKDGKIMEHWDVAMPVPEKAANENGMF
jgi:predicted SnoaL-like aldol condensation-catalyzing enzyme